MLFRSTPRPLPSPRDTIGAGREAVDREPAPRRLSPSSVVESALRFRGVPYRNGGADPKGFDCSGFTRHIFELSVGLVLPRRADEQAQMPGLLSVNRDDLKPGDLVFFNTLRHTFSHVGIYIGDNKFIHSPKPGQEVQIQDMRQAYWDRRFTGARRVKSPNVEQ